MNPSIPRCFFLIFASMKIMEVPYNQINKFSKLVVDYVNEDKNIKPFINHFPTLENFEKQIIEKQNHPINRVLLREVLKEQNANFTLSKKTKNNIDTILNKNTFTITTGHQLCLFTGPLYFIYKIITAINLSQQLEEKYPKNNFIPVFWMATEDHDFKEINHINLFGKKIAWNSKQFGAVGSMNLEGFDAVIKALKSVLGNSQNAQKLIRLFENAYLKQNKLADATRFLVNELFGKHGLVILDGDDKRLKTQFIPIIKKDILQKGFVKTIQNCSNDLAENYKTQAHVRDVNFFRLSERKRELIKEGIIGQVKTIVGYGSPNLINHGCHWYDMAFALAGDVEPIWVNGYIDELNNQDIGTKKYLDPPGRVTIKLDNGCFIHILPDGFGVQFTVIGSEGYLITLNDFKRVDYWKHDALNDPITLDFQNEKDDWLAGPLAISDLVDSIRFGSKTSCDLEETRRATEIGFAVYASNQENGVPVPLPAKNRQIQVNSLPWGNE